MNFIHKLFVSFRLKRTPKFPCWIIDILLSSLWWKKNILEFGFGRPCILIVAVCVFISENLIFCILRSIWLCWFGYLFCIYLFILLIKKWLNYWLLQLLVSHCMYITLQPLWIGHLLLGHFINYIMFRVTVSVGW